MSGSYQLLGGIYLPCGVSDNEYGIILPQIPVTSLKNFSGYQGFASPS